MGFHVSCNFNYINSYDLAVKAWNDGVILPGLHARGLVNKRKKHMVVDLQPNKDVVLWLYNHPIVTWHKDGAITLAAYKSRSTVVFANHCTPDGWYTRICGGYFSVTIDKRTYKIKDESTFRPRDGTWEPDQIAPWLVPVVNRKRAKQALQESGYTEFRLWLKVYVQMAERPTDRWPWRDSATVLNLLQDRSTWRELAARLPDAWANPERALETVRKTVYHQHNCIEGKSVPYLGASR